MLKMLSCFFRDPVARDGDAFAERPVRPDLDGEIRKAARGLAAARQRFVHALREADVAGGVPPERTPLPRRAPASPNLPASAESPTRPKRCGACAAAFASAPRGAGPLSRPRPPSTVCASATSPPPRP